MSLKTVHYKRLETEDSEGDEDESPPTHVTLHNPHYGKENKWNHIEDLDEFFEKVYLYLQEHGLAAIVLNDFLELVQFLFMVLFTTFLITCLKLRNLVTDKITYYVSDNNTGERDVLFSDLFDISQLENINPIIVIFLLLALIFWLHRLYRAVRRFFKFWEIRTFYTEALNISSSELRDSTWADVVTQLKHAQKEYKMNIRKQDLTELDVYHRILRFKNYLVAMINKSVLPSRFWVPFYGEKLFLTHGLLFNYEIILFWGPGAPFRNSFYLCEEYKSAANKHKLVKNLRFRITVLALLNLIFCPVILLYQILYSFFSYAELMKRQPGVFSRRRWSLYGRYFLRDFNELDHELMLRLNRAYIPSSKYVDLFANPILAIIARNIAFVCGSLLAVLLALTVIQEDLLTAHNILTVITLLGIIVTVCRVFIPHENQAWCPSQLMQQILGDVHYMPDHWKQRPHTVEVYTEYTHVFQFTMMHVVDELLSPLLTPFILFLSLRNHSSDIVDFFRNFTIDVSGVGDVCSFAEMNIKKHGNPEWLTKGVTRANQYQQAELGKTEISLMHFSRKNPNWRPSEDGAAFMTQLRESVEEMHRSGMSESGGGGNYPVTQDSEESLAYLTMQPATADYYPPINTGTGVMHVPMTSHPVDPMQWSIWSIRPGYPALSLAAPSQAAASLDTSTIDTLNLHQLRDQMKAKEHLSSSDPTRPITLSSSRRRIEVAWAMPSTIPQTSETDTLTEPLLVSQDQPAAAGSREHARDNDATVYVHMQDSSEQQ